MARQLAGQTHVSLTLTITKNWHKNQLFWVLLYVFSSIAGCCRLFLPFGRAGKLEDFIQGAGTRRKASSG
jgi:hypothetical protein